MATRPPAASAQAHVVLQTAFERFNNIVSQDDKHVFNDTTLQDVREEALRIERGLRERRMQKNMLRLEPFLKGLERYSKAMEVLCNGTPFLPWIWAPIKLMLLSALDALSAFEKLVEAYGKIAHVLPRLERLSAAFSHDVNFQNTLALVYSDILEIHRNSYKFVRRKSWKILFGSTWARFETRFSGILQRLAYHSDLLDKEAYAINISETLRHNEEELWRWEQQDAELETLKYHKVLSWLRMNESSSEYTLRKHCDKSLPDSSDWFINQDKMQLWQKDGNENALVWITGKPGAGKSVLCSNIIRSIQATRLQVLYYFCSYLGDSSDRCSRLLRSLACQIIQNHRDLAIHVYDTYYVSHSNPDTPVTMSLLQELLLEIGSTRIIIDGVDEWSDHQRELVMHLRKLIITNSSSYTCKILISSRDTLEVSRNFVKRNKMIAFSNLSDGLESAAIKQSISCFIEARLKDLPSHFDDVDPGGSIVARIKQKLLDKSNGMFLWVRLVVDSLSSIYSPEDLNTIVDNLPSDLNSLYAQIFNGLCSVAGPQRYGGVPRIIGWICYAQRPLHKHELAHAISIGSLGLHSNNQSIPVIEILDHCKPLIEFRQDGTVTFVHFSVKEFFLACKTPGIISSPQAQLDLASASVGMLAKGLDLLQQTNGQTEILAQVASGFYRFLSYAIEFWIEHCLLYVRNVGTFAVHETFLDWLSLLQDKHDFLAQTLRHESRQHDASILTSDNDVDERIQPYTGRPAQTLMRDTLRTQGFVSRQDCENGIDAENSMEQHDPTLLSKLAVEFERSRVFLLSHETVGGVPAPVLSAFQKSYTSITLRCRFPNCSVALEGFPSEQLRVRHESGHVRRVYCKVESCQYHRIGFKDKPAHDKHDQEFHRESRSIFVPQRIRRVGKTQVFRLSLRTKERTLQQFNPGFANAQLQRPVQTSPVPTAQQGSNMGMDVETPKFSQGQQSQQPNVQQQPQQLPQSQKDMFLSQVAKSILDACGSAIRRKFQLEVDAWPKKDREELLSQGIDPLFFRFRQHAELLYKDGKLKLQSPQEQQRPDSAGRQQDGQPSQIQGQQANIAQQHSTPAFNSNKIRNQQLAAARLQDLGEEVVPTSNNNNNSDQTGIFRQGGKPQHAAMAKGLGDASFFPARSSTAMQQNQNQELRGQAMDFSIPPVSQRLSAMSILNQPMNPPDPQGLLDPQQRPPQAWVPQSSPQSSQEQLEQLSWWSREVAAAPDETQGPLTDAARMATMSDFDPDVQRQSLKVPELEFLPIVPNY